MSIIPQVGEQISNQSVTDTAMLYLRHLPDIPEDFIALAPYAVMKSFLRHPEKVSYLNDVLNFGIFDPCHCHNHATSRPFVCFLSQVSSADVI